MKYYHNLPPDVASWQELYVIFTQAGLSDQPAAAYHYEDSQKKKGVLLAVYYYEMAFVEKQVAQELLHGDLLLSGQEWKVIYDQLLKAPDTIPFPLLEKVNKLHSLVRRRSEEPPAQ